MLSHAPADRVGRFAGDEGIDDGSLVLAPARSLLVRRARGFQAGQEYVGIELGFADDAPRLFFERQRRHGWQRADRLPELLRLCRFVAVTFVVRMRTVRRPRQHDAAMSASEQRPQEKSILGFRGAGAGASWIAGSRSENRSSTSPSRRTRVGRAELSKFDGDKDRSTRRERAKHVAPALRLRMRKEGVVWERLGTR
jgi:hypothetical protein